MNTNKQQWQHNNSHWRTKVPVFTRSAFRQLWILQFFISKLLPSQIAPPFIGFGELHSRLRYFCPFPQVLLQAVHGDQSDQPPSTKIKKKNIQRIITFLGNTTYWHKIVRSKWCFRYYCLHNMHHRDSLVDCHNFLYEFSFHFHMLQNRDSKNTTLTIPHYLHKMERYKFVVRSHFQNMVYHLALE